MSYPDGLVILQEELWFLPGSDLRTFWQALGRARFVRPRTWRQQVLLVGRLKVSADLLGRLCDPRVLVHMLEDLVLEGLLTRQQASRMEEQVLSRLQANGRWVGDPEPTGLAASFLSPDVQVLATYGT